MPKSKYPKVPDNPKRGSAPLYGLVSTKTVAGRKKTYKTKGDTEGYDHLHVKIASNHGAIQVNLFENGDFEVKAIPWQSNVVDEEGEPVMRGTNRKIAEGNLRDLEDVYGKDGKGQQMPFWEDEAHKEYADEQ